MAEDKDQSVEQDQKGTSTTKVKRRLKTDIPSKASGETVRERSEKHRKLQEASDGASKSGFVRSFFYGFTWPLRWLGRQIAKLGRFRVFRIIGKILLPSYFRNSWRELRLVTWPNRRQSWRLTYAVIVFSIIFGVIVFIVDLLLDKLFKEFILK